MFEACDNRTSMCLNMNGSFSCICHEEQRQLAADVCLSKITANIFNYYYNNYCNSLIIVTLIMMIIIVIINQMKPENVTLVLLGLSPTLCRKDSVRKMIL